MTTTAFNWRRLLLILVAIIFILLIAIWAFFAWYSLAPVSEIPPEQKVDKVVYLNQGWGEEASTQGRDHYYFTPQGTSMPQGATTAALRYDWFVNLELPFSEQRFASPEHMRHLRFIVDDKASDANPDQLPIGFTKHYSEAIGEDVLDISCAACHSGEIHYRRDNTNYAIRIDGGQAMHAFTDMTRGSFAPMLMASLINTAINPWAFDRFAEQVLKDRYPEAKDALKDNLWTVIKGFLGSKQNNPMRHLYPVQEGFGRTDALGRIANTVFGDHLVEKNYHVAKAPVSYPYLWNIWKFDWVQYNGSVAQPLARNIGEALGVGAHIPMLNANGGPLPIEDRFRSSVRIDDLQTIEHTLQSLTPPPWPENILGNVDQTLAKQGEQLFVQHCQGCHGPHPASAAQQQVSAPLKPSPDAEWLIEVIPTTHIGTDATAANAFMEREYDLSSTGITDEEIGDTLRPLFWRQLSRQVLSGLQQVIDLRTAQEKPLGDLPQLLADYPNPDASAEMILPEESFKNIAQALLALQSDLPQTEEKPTYSDSCDLSCQSSTLMKRVTKGSATIESALSALSIKKLTEGEALNLVGLLIKNRFYADNNIDYAQQQCLEGFGTLDLPQQIAGYKPRPLAGVWATPPFLHNGSVPNIYQMLLPPEQRDKVFYLGDRSYDPKHLGYVVHTNDDNNGGFRFDTSTEGNSNTGHGFTAAPAMWIKHKADPKANPLPSGVIGPELTDSERFALIEYLKVHRDLPETPTGYQPPHCNL